MTPEARLLSGMSHLVTGCASGLTARSSDWVHTSDPAVDQSPTTFLQNPLGNTPLLAPSLALNIQPLTFYLSSHQRVAHMGRSSVPHLSHGLFKHREVRGMPTSWPQKPLSPDHISLCICSKARFGVWIWIRGAPAHLRPTPSTPS